MPSWICRGLSLGLLCMLLSCQQPPDLSGELNEYTRLLNEVNFESCSCPQDLGYASMVECDEGVGTVDNADQECLADVLDGSEEIGKDHLDCANSAYGLYVQCLASNPNCNDGWYEECTSEHIARVGACPQLPADLQPMFAVCVQ